ncbi:MAG: hypothetical protein JJ863_26900 [Deltaproteobacteria bacterium]|nr:hypothetical protein [Deltaproteobacteria bacterium]
MQQRKGVDVERAEKDWRIVALLGVCTFVTACSQSYTVAPSGDGGPGASRDAGPSVRDANARSRDAGPARDTGPSIADGGDPLTSCGGAWSGERVVGEGSLPTVAMLPEGLAFVAYVDAMDRVMLASSVPHESWFAPTALGQAENVLLSEPRIMVEPERALVTWRTPDGTIGLSFVRDGMAIGPRRFPAGIMPRIASHTGGGTLVWRQAGGGEPTGVGYADITGGTTPPMLVPGTEGRSTESVAIASSGRRRALAWLEDRSNVRASVDLGGGWSAPVTLGETSAGFAGRPDLAMNEAGEILVVWADGGSVQQARFDPVSGWSGVDPVDPGSDGFAFLPHVVLTDSGWAHVVWERFSDAGTELRANRRNPDDLWHEPITVSASAGDGMVDKIALTLGRADTAHVVFLRPEGDRPGQVVASCVHPGVDWSPAVRLDSGGDLVSPRTSVGGTPFLAASESGRVVAVWPQGGEVRSNEWNAE